ncbi:hypothetical protein GCM10022241_10980 [Micrococcus endophyticus]
MGRGEGNSLTDAWMKRQGVRDGDAFGGSGGRVRPGDGDGGSVACGGGAARQHVQEESQQRRRAQVEADGAERVDAGGQVRQQEGEGQQEPEEGRRAVPIGGVDPRSLPQDAAPALWPAGFCPDFCPLSEPFPCVELIGDRRGSGGGMRR